MSPTVVVKPVDDGERALVQPASNVLRLTIPVQRTVRLRRELAPVIPLHPPRHMGERRELVASLLGVALMIAVTVVAFFAFVAVVRSEGGPVGPPMLPIAWW